jgi:tRNA A37 threonylcarbamoyladenosine synthetase subunit TsaC/SUA5/YrdC
VPLTATSLNRSGAPPARTRGEARALCDGVPSEPRLLDVEGAEAGGEQASTVVDVSSGAPRVLRWGAVAEAELAPRLRELGGG